MIKAVIFDMYETLITHYETPLYFSEQMAHDARIPEDKFQALWRASEKDRTVGKISFEEIIRFILEKNDCYSEDKFNLIVKKRIQTKEELFKHMHPEIITLLDSLKKKGLLIGLISNCFSEEAAVIKSSVLYPYFDAPCLSYDEGLQKPDTAIFQRCLEKLNTAADECLYIGDGGSFELESAQKIGMYPVQAVWYLKEGTLQTSKRDPEFRQAESPSDILNIIIYTDL